MKKKDNKKNKKAVQANSDDYKVYYDWGKALSYWALCNEPGKERDDLFNKAFEKYEKAAQISPGDFSVNYAWENALTRFVKNQTGKEADDLCNKAFEKYIKAAPIEFVIYVCYSLGGVLIELAKTKTGKEAEDILMQGVEKYQNAVDLGGQCYGLACALALLKNKEKALFYLEKCLEQQEKKIDSVLKDEDWTYYLKDEDFLNIIERYK